MGDGELEVVLAGMEFLFEQMQMFWSDSGNGHTTSWIILKMDCFLVSIEMS